MTPPPPENPDVEITRLIATLHATGKRLEELTGGQVDAVADPEGGTFLLRRAQEHLRYRQAAKEAAILDALPAHIAMLDADGTIRSVNAAWRRFASANALQRPGYGVGTSYLDVCDRARGEGASDASAVAAGIRAVLGGAPDFSYEYPCHCPTEQRWFLLRVTPLAAAGRHGAVVMHLNITERKLAEIRMRASEISMSAAQGIAHFGSWELDLTDQDAVDGNALRWSDEMYRIAGYEPQSVEISSAFFFRLVPVEDHAPLREAIESAIRTRRPYSFVHRLIRPDGEERIVQERGHLITDEKTGRPAKVIGTAHDITARTRADEILQRQQTELRVLFDLMPAMIWFKDTHNGILRVNKRVAEVAGKPVKDIEGRNSRDIYPEDAAKFYADDLEIIRSGEPKLGYVEKVRHPDGQEAWMQTDKVPYRDKEGSVIGIVVMAQDITARKKAEMEVRFNEQRYRSLMQATTAIVWDTPPSGEFEVVQPAWTAFTGQSFEEYQGWGWLHAIHPDDQAETARIWSAAVASRSVYSVEHRVQKWDRTYRNMQVQGVPILGEDGNIRQWIGIHTDITERKQAEQRITEQAALIDEARDAIVVRDLGHRITFWSKGASRLYGWTPEEARGRLLHELLRTDAAKFTEADRAVQEAGEWNGEIQKTAQDGAVLTLDARWTLMRDAHGRPESILSIDTDITSRKKIEQQFLRSQRMESIGTLAGGIAHDLNNVLAPILMGVEILKLKHPGSTRILNQFETSANRGAGMVRQLLTFAKGTKGERVSIQTSHLVMELKELMHGTFPKNIAQVVTCAPDLPTVLGDASQLHQILLNLCVNGRDAMPSGGILTLEAHEVNVDASYAAGVPDAIPGSYLALRVRDTGTGIAPEILERIFDPFFTTKGPDQGTGLGLSTVMGIVKGMGGFLQVASAPGLGSTFTVHLPAEVTGAGMVPAAGALEIHAGHGETILMVDDESAVLEVGRMVLEALNYNVIAALDGSDGLMKAIEHRQELRAVITDLHMPHMDGLAFVRALRRVLPDIPVIIGSGRVDEAAAASLKTLGVIHRLDKPYAQGMLAAILAKLLDGTALRGD